MIEVPGCAERWNWVGDASVGDWREAKAALVRAASLLPPTREGLEWCDEPCVLAGERVDTEEGGRPALRVGSLTLVLLDDDDQLLKTTPLAGTLGEPKEAALSDIERWLSNAAAVLDSVSRCTRGASRVRTDPDTLQTSLEIDLPSRAGEPERAIVVAFGLGNDDVDPLITVTAQPDGRPDTLPLSRISALGDGDAQAKAVERFIIEALERAYESLRREWRRR